MRRSRLVLLLLAGLLVALPDVSRAAGPAPQVTDPKGDAVALGASYDIVSAQLKTTGTTKKVGRKTVYTPTKLVATVTFAGPVSTQPGTYVNFDMDTSACDGGSFSYSYRPGSLVLNEGDLYVSGCGPADALGPSTFYGDAYPVVKGSTITWTLPLKLIGTDLPLGSTFRNFSVRVDVAEPATYIVGTSLVSATAIDRATSRVFWELA